jgi:hypothetical protein
MQVIFRYPLVEPSFPKVAERPVSWATEGLRTEPAPDHKAIVDLNRRTMVYWALTNFVMPFDRSDTPEAILSFNWKSTALREVVFTSL